MNELDTRRMLILHLKRDEGFRSSPYRDTVGKLSIGYGRNLDDVGITQEEAEVLLTNDINQAIRTTQQIVPNLKEKPWQVRLGLYNMAFNMGRRLSGFAKMLDAIDKDDFERAADEALDSRWASQVGKRAERIAALFREAAEE